MNSTTLITIVLEEAYNVNTHRQNNYTDGRKEARRALGYVLAHELRVQDDWGHC